MLKEPNSFDCQKYKIPDEILVPPYALPLVLPAIDSPKIVEVQRGEQFIFSSGGLNSIILGKDTTINIPYQKIGQGLLNYWQNHIYSSILQET